MDPLSLTVSVASLLTMATQVVKASCDLRSRYKEASFMLSAISTECTVINTSLSILQSLMLSDVEVLRSRMTPNVISTFEVALQGCTLTMSVVEDELHGLLRENDRGESKPNRLKYMFEQGTLKEMLQQIRGQQIGVSLLLQTYQAESSAEVRKVAQRNNALLHQIANRGRSFYLESLHDGERRIIARSAMTVDDSVFDMSSVIDDRQFDFDDEITSAMAYRRALAGLRQAGASRNKLSEAADSANSVLTPRAGSARSVESLLVDSTKSSKVANGDNAVDGDTLRTLQQQKSNAGTNTLTVQNPGQTLNSDFKLSMESMPGINSTSSHMSTPIADETSKLDLDWIRSLDFSFGETSFGTTLEPRSHSQVQSADYTVQATSPLVAADEPGRQLFQDTNVDAVKQSANTDDPSKSHSPTAWKSAAAIKADMENDYRFGAPGLANPMPTTEETTEETTLIKETVSRASTRIKCALVGDGASGKTYAVLKFLQGHTEGIPYCPTVHATYTGDVEVDGKQVEVTYWDTPGQEDYDRWRPLFYPDTHVCIIFFAIDSPDSLDNVQEKWISEVMHFMPGIPIILVGCKKELRYDQKTIEELRKTSQKPVTPEQGEAVQKRIGAYKYLECSAYTNDGIRKVFEETARAGTICRRLADKKRKKRTSWLFRRAR